MKFQIEAMLSYVPASGVNVKTLELRDQFEAIDPNAAILKARKIVIGYYRRHLDAKVLRCSAELRCIKPVWRTRFQQRDPPATQFDTKPLNVSRAPFLEETLDVG